MNNITLTDMSGAYIEHSMIITNFVSLVSAPLKNSLCRVFPDNVQYTWWFGDEKKTVIPDASINCQVRARRGNTFVNAPQFVMEVLSDSTEKYDRTEKKDIYRKEEIGEYWIVDWRKRTVEIYNLDYDENQEPQYYLFQTVAEKNKEELGLVHFPHIEINFDMLFDIGY